MLIDYKNCGLHHVKCKVKPNYGLIFQLALVGIILAYDMALFVYQF